MYAINPSTGAATQIGTTPFSTSLPAGGTWSVDFNPTVDRVRVVHSGGLNLRVNQTDGTLAATDTPVSAGTVNALAYDRSVAGTTGTTLYVLDGTADRLASMGSINSAPQSPNSGVLNAIGGLGTDAQADIAFDIAPASSAFAGTAIATMQVGGTQGLYTVDLRTGAATLQGTVAAALIDLAVLRRRRSSRSPATEPESFVSMRRRPVSCRTRSPSPGSAPARSSSVSTSAPRLVN